MSLSSRSGSQAESRGSADAIRFECACKLDGRGSASLELSGELDRAVCEELEARLAEAQRASAVVTLDLRRLTFMDGGGYGVLVWAAQDARPEAKLVLAGCSGQVRRLLDLIGLPEKVEFAGHSMPSADAAVLSATPLGSGAAIGV